MSEDAPLASPAAGPLDGGNDVSRRSAADWGWMVTRHPGVFVAVAAITGAGLGVVARVWMRWISVDPEFSWTGTLAILAGFTVFAAAQAAAVVRIRSSRPATGSETSRHFVEACDELRCWGDSPARSRVPVVIADYL